MLTLTADSMALRYQNCLGVSFLRQRGRYFVSVKNSDFAQKSPEESSKPSAPCPNWTRKPGKTNTVKFRKQAPGLIFFKCTVFSLFYFVYEGNFQVQAPVGLKCGGAYIYMYIWRGLFSEFYGTWLRTPKCTSTLFHGSKTWTTYTKQYRRLWHQQVAETISPTVKYFHVLVSSVYTPSSVIATWEDSAMCITWMMDASQGSSIRTIDNSSQEGAPHSATLRFMDACRWPQSLRIWPKQLGR